MESKGRPRGKRKASRLGAPRKAVAFGAIAIALVGGGYAAWSHFGHPAVITAKSAPDEGATFLVTLPLRQSG